jgi:dihydroflavonol-4-reductase
MAKALVTGASGFLGQWLTKKLIEMNHEVSVLVRGSDYPLAKARIFKGDITDFESVSKACVGQDVVFHLAGIISYDERQRSLMEKVNVGGTFNVVTACEKQHVEKLIHLSSVVAVGAGFSSNQILNEQSTYNLTKYNFGYFETKRKAEKLVLEAAKNKKIFGVCINPSTIYGEGDAVKESRNTQLSAARGKLLFYPSGGVSIVSVEDVIDGTIAAYEKGRSGERYILSGENLYLKEVFTSISKLAGQSPPKFQMPDFIMKTLANIDRLAGKVGMHGPLPAERALVSTMFHWYDHSKATFELGFQPRPAVYALEKSVNWMKSHGYI